MTTVICSVCSQCIASEHDRVYCFGGCEQILHTKCSDLSCTGPSALRENNALKYMCFGCRKKQTTLNDIQKQCTQLMKKVDDLVGCVNKNNLLLPGLVKAEVEKNNAALVTHILSAFKNIDRNCNLHATTSTIDQVCADKPSFASVVLASDEPPAKGKKRKAPDDLLPNRESRNATVILSNIDSTAVLEEGGLLRSGKRRHIENQSRNNPINSPLLLPPPVETEIPRSPRKKSSTVMKMEQTVLFKPKQSQHAQTTKHDICEKFDPIEFAVKELHLRESGEVAVRCENKDQALKLVKAATDMLSVKYTIDIQKPLKPRIKIIGFSKVMSEEKLVSNLKQQNPGANLLDVKVIRITRNEKRTSNQMSVILETDACGFDTLMKLKQVNLGWERCRVLEATDVMRCFNCSEYGHKAASCVKTACCPKCAGDHKINECLAEFEKCINCHRVNMERQSSDDELLDVTHSSWSSDCPFFVKQLKKARQRIDFSI